MNYSTILRIRRVLTTQGMQAAVDAFRAVYPLGDPCDFILFILGARRAAIR